MMTTHELSEMEHLPNDLPNVIFGLRYDEGLNRRPWNKRYEAKNGFAVYHMVRDVYGDYFGILKKYELKPVAACGDAA